MINTYSIKTCLNKQLFNPYKIKTQTNKKTKIKLKRNVIETKRLFQPLIYGKCTNTFESTPNTISKIPKIPFIPEIKI